MHAKLLGLSDANVLTQYALLGQLIYELFPIKISYEFV